MKTHFSRSTNKRKPMVIMMAFAVVLCSVLASEALGRDRYLLLDSRIVESTENVELRIGTVKKDARNPLFAEDKSWEPRFDNVYANVIYDREDNLYKCWYSPFIIDKRTTSTPEEERNPITGQFSRVIRARTLYWMPAT